MSRSPLPTAGSCTCPKCGAANPVDPGYSSWCDRCGWNLEIPLPEGPRSAYEKFAERVFREGGRRHGPEILAEMIRDGEAARPRSALSILGCLAAALIDLAVLGLFVLLRRDQQMAEYRADLLAARIGGTAGVTGWLSKFHMHRTVELTVQRFTLNGEKGDLYADLRACVAGMPARELERIRRAERTQGRRLDATHPPTVDRLELLASRPTLEPEVVLSAEATRAIDAELDALPPEVRRAPVEHYLAQIYG